MKSIQGSNIIRVKSHNRKAILLRLLRSPLSRVELANALALSSMTVTNLVNEMLEDDWLLNCPATAVSHRQAGRPRRRLQLNPQAGYTIGVHIGIGILRIGLVNMTGQLVQNTTASFDISLPAAEILAQILAHINQLIAESKVDPAKVMGIGVGASGLIDTHQGVCFTAPSLNWHDVPIGEYLHRRTNLPTIVENNVRAMALAEAYFGQGQDAATLAFIYGRVGVGAGFVMNGTLFRGTQAGAGEIGHTIILNESPIQCRCGQMGCLETLVTQPIIEQRLADSNIHLPGCPEDCLDNHRFEQILDLARAGNTAVLRAVETSADYLGIALINLINTLNPDRIILGGMYFQGADIYLPRLRHFTKEHAFGGLGKNVQITASSFGLDAGIIGAASLALMAYFYETT